MRGALRCCDQFLLAASILVCILLSFFALLAVVPPTGSLIRRMGVYAGFV